MEDLLHLIDTCKSLSEIARNLYGNDNFTSRNKVKVALLEQGIDWKEWKLSKKIKQCLNCGKDIPVNKKFCNSSCSASYNNRLRNVTIKYCLNCGKEIKNTTTYCNNTCASEFKYKQYIKDWQNGIESGMAGSDGISSRVRRYLLEKVNYTCEIPECNCNYINPYTGLSILQIHHIDGDATNNKESNLQVLCPNHHAMTETFGSRNKSTRKYRYSKNASEV